MPVSYIYYWFTHLAEFAEGGSLFDLIHKNKKKFIPDYEQCLQWAKEIAEGIDLLFLHPSNVPVNADGR